MSTIINYAPDERIQGGESIDNRIAQWHELLDSAGLAELSELNSSLQSSVNRRLKGLTKKFSETTFKASDIIFENGVPLAVEDFQWAIYFASRVIATSTEGGEQVLIDEKEKLSGVESEEPVTMGFLFDNLNELANIVTLVQFTRGDEIKFLQPGADLTVH